MSDTQTAPKTNTKAYPTKIDGRGGRPDFWRVFSPWPQYGWLSARTGNVIWHHMSRSRYKTEAAAQRKADRLNTAHEAEEPTP